MSTNFENQLDSFLVAKIDNKAIDIELLFQKRLQKQFETNCAAGLEKITMLNRTDISDSTQ